tara:strand:- start:3830 stop:4258 length:429 start_codon:yes stop_codon:yes gene_type:complete
MIESKIKILSEYLSKQKNVTWRESKAFDEIVEHCLCLDNNYKDKTLYLERLASWYVDHMFELNQDHINEVSYEFVEGILLRKLKLILEIPAESNYTSIENNIMALDIENNNKLKAYGAISKAIKLLVKDILVYNTKDKYETS